MKLKPSDFDWDKYDHHVMYMKNAPVSPASEVWDGERWTNQYLTGGWYLIRYPKPEPLYQLLTPGMEIQDGDDWWRGCGEWSRGAAATQIGRKVADGAIWRRKLPEGTKLP